MLGDVIEEGVRWINVMTVSSDISPLSDMRSIVDGDHLGQYAVTSAETGLLSRVTVTTLFSPEFGVSSNNYDNGNHLLGL